MKVSKARSSRDMRSSRKRELSLLTRADRAINEIKNQKRPGWEVINVKIDSGAIDSCLPKSAGSGFRTKESKMSKEGSMYRAANGTSIRNYGETELKGWTKEGTPFNFKTQVADVKNALGSVYHMVKSGNRVEFNEKGGTIVNVKTGQEIPIHERGVSYEIDLCIQAKESAAQEGIGTGNRFQALVEQDNSCGDDDSGDFIRLDECL